MTDPAALLRTATRRAKSDVANKLISMFLHELSRSASKNWPMRVESDEKLLALFAENREADD